MPTPNTPITGVHHVTAIASDARANLEFYTRVLGQRLVKKTVNFDDPGTYHLYYGDAEGSPGSIMTFFPWPGARRGTAGAGQATTTHYRVPQGAVPFWQERLERFGIATQTHDWLGEPALLLRDPDGLRLRLIESTIDTSTSRQWSGDSEDAIAAEYAIRDFAGIEVSSLRDSPTAQFLTDVMGFSAVANDGGTRRFTVTDDANSQHIDLTTIDAIGRGGAGTVHHIAFRVPSDEVELAWKQHVEQSGFGVSPVMDRQYFHSIYFREPGGVLFEIATDPPGFAVDENVEQLGEALKLPAGLESRRARIEASLPSLELEPAGA